MKPKNLKGEMKNMKKMEIKCEGQSESCKIVRAMQGNEISPLEGWRALKVAYAAMSPADREEDYICAVDDMDYDDNISKKL